MLGKQLRQAFTVLELLIVIGIAALLLAILLPAVQYARAHSRQLQCSASLRQIGLAMQGYLDQFGVFPPINLPTGHTVFPRPYSAHRYSPISRMLPWLEQSNLFDHTNFAFIPDQAAGLVANQTVMITTLKVALCPSDTSSTVPGFGRNNVRFNIGPTFWAANNPDWPETIAGPFSVHRVYRSTDFEDGLSNTVGASERTQGDWTSNLVGRGDYYVRVLDVLRDRLSTDRAVEICTAVQSTWILDSKAGETWFISGLSMTLYNHCMTPNAVVLDCALYPFNTVDIHDRAMVDGVITARSYHLGGVNTLFMDGSSRFISDNVDLTIWRSLATRSGSESTGGYW